MVDGDFVTSMTARWRAAFPAAPSATLVLPELITIEHPELACWRPASVPVSEVVTFVDSNQADFTTDSFRRGPYEMLLELTRPTTAGPTGRVVRASASFAP